MSSKSKKSRSSARKSKHAAAAPAPAPAPPSAPAPAPAPALAPQAQAPRVKRFESAEFRKGRSLLRKALLPPAQPLLAPSAGVPSPATPMAYHYTPAPTEGSMTQFLMRNQQHQRDLLRAHDWQAAMKDLQRMFQTLPGPWTAPPAFAAPGHPWLAEALHKGGTAFRAFERLKEHWNSTAGIRALLSLANAQELKYWQELSMAEQRQQQPNVEAELRRRHPAHLAEQARLTQLRLRQEGEVQYRDHLKLYLNSLSADPSIGQEQTRRLSQWLSSNHNLAPPQMVKGWGEGEWARTRFNVERNVNHAKDKIGQEKASIEAADEALGIAARGRDRSMYRRQACETIETAIAVLKAYHPHPAAPFARQQVNQMLRKLQNKLRDECPGNNSPYMTGAIFQHHGGGGGAKKI